METTPVTRAVRLWRLEQRALALSASLHRLTIAATRAQERATAIRLTMTLADRIEYDQLVRLEGQRKTEEVLRCRP